MKLGTLKKIEDLRSVWAHEATEFTPWLAKEENLDILGEAIGIELILEDTEVKVGNFSIDILAKEAETNRKIIIENQLEDTNHDHLGKAITYAAGKDAEVVVWIVKTAREEHRKAIEWLNNHTDENVAFFLIEMELWTIDGSAPAPKFNIVERPNDWAKQIKSNTGNISDTEQLRLNYWTALKDYAAKQPVYAKELRLRKPSKDHWYSLSLGIGGTHISFLLQRERNEIEIELHIENNKSLYHHYESQKSAIEGMIGCPLDWRELPDAKASRIILTNSDVNITEQSEWEKQFDWLLKYALLYKKAFAKYSK